MRTSTATTKWRGKERSSRVGWSQQIEQHSTKGRADINTRRTRKYVSESAVQLFNTHTGQGAVRTGRTRHNKGAAVHVNSTRMVVGMGWRHTQQQPKRKTTGYGAYVTNNAGRTYSQKDVMRHDNQTQQDATGPTDLGMPLHNTGQSNGSVDDTSDRSTH
jgi:hypothetical protein